MLTQAKLLEGKVLAAEIREQIKNEADGFVAKGLKRPKLAVIQVGEDPSADWYIGQQKKWAEKLGIDFEQVIKAGEIKNQQALVQKIQEMNQSDADGVFIAMPLPKGFNSDEALLALDPKKDVEGIHPASLGLIVLRKSKLIPPTAYAAFCLIESTGIALRG